MEGRRGKRRKVHQGTYIKDPWTKPKEGGFRVGGWGRWGGGEWWGENGDSCT